MPRKRFSFEPFSLHHALSTLIILTLAFSFCQFYPNPQNYWLLLSSILLSQGGLGAEQSDQALFQPLYYLAYAFLAATLVLILSLSSPYFILALLLVSLTTFSSNYLGWLQRQFFFPAFAINLLGILAVFYPTDLKTALYRCCFILVGGLMVFLVQALFFLYQRPRRATYAWVTFLQKLQKLYQLILDTSGPEDENRFQAAWCACLSAMELFKRLNKNHYNLERIWDITLSLGSLRYRISDKPVLSMCENELKDIEKALLSLLTQAQKGKSADIDFHPLEASIERLDELYQSMLQTAANEPLVLLLFIQDLHALAEEVEKLFLQLAPSPPKLCLRGEGGGEEVKPLPHYPRRAFRATIAVFFALLVSRYLSPVHSFWLVATTALVTQSELGLPLHQSLLRCLWIILILLGISEAMVLAPAWGLPALLFTLVTVFSYWYAYTSRRYLSLHFPLLALCLILLALLVPAPPMNLSYFLDVVCGIGLGLLSSLVIFPDKPDLEFAIRVLPLLKNSATYLNELIDLFLQKDAPSQSTQTRAALETFWANRDRYFPIWVFEPGFNPALRAGHHYFVVHLGQMTEILFAMNHFARHEFAPDLLQDLAIPIRDSAARTQALFSRLMAALEGKPLPAAEADEMADVLALEENFQSTVNLKLELLDLSRDYVYLAAFIRYLKDLRKQVLQLASTLR